MIEAIMLLNEGTRQIQIQTGDVRLIKKMNDQIVLNLIRKNGSISGAELANITRMRPSTISNILKDLSARSLLVNLGKGESTSKGGKRPDLWGLNKDAIYALGIDIEVGQITAVAVDLCSNIIGRDVYQSAPAANIEELIAQIRNAVDRIISDHNIDRDRIAGLGIAFAGVVDCDQGIVRLTSVIPQRDVPLIHALTPYYNFPMYVENNANAAAIGLKWFDSARGISNFLTVLVEIEKNVGGMGIGVVINNELYYGANYCAGEVNIPLPKLGELLRQLQSRFPGGSILQHYAQSLEELDITRIIEATRQRDKLAIAFCETLGFIIGKSIAKPVALINPEKVIIAGDIAEVGKYITNPIHAAVVPEILPLVADSLKIETSGYGRDSVAIGSAALILNDFFRVPLESTRSNISVK